MINDIRDIFYLKSLLEYEKKQMEEAQVSKDFFEYASVCRWLNFLSELDRDIITRRGRAKMPPRFEDWRSFKNFYDICGLFLITKDDMELLFGTLERYEKALLEIQDLRRQLQYVDEWQEASCYNQSELIVEKALKNEGEE